MKIETLAVHAGRAPDPATGALAMPIHPSTTFERAADGSFPHGFIYGRSGNPNRAALEECLRILEGGATAAAFASGSAAMAAVFHALAPGDHVVLSDGYYGTARLLRTVFGRWGLRATVIDTSDLDALRRAMEPRTALVWLETPTNPLLRVTDIAAAAEIAHAAGARLAVDNTTATPLLQHPLQLGADLVMHSTTKYLGGHSDVTGGVIVGTVDDEIFARVRASQSMGGAIPSPFDCWLILRGITTLPYRVRAQSESALAVARFLAEHPAVTRVHYPGLPDHPGHAVAARQMSRFGGLMSVQVRDGRDGAMRVAARLAVFTRATSLGGAESLVEHRASVEAAGTTTPEDLLRISIGLEHPDDLIEDLAQALRNEE